MRRSYIINTLFNNYLYLDVYFKKRYYIKIEENGIFTNIINLLKKFIEIR